MSSTNAREPGPPPPVNDSARAHSARAGSRSAVKSPAGNRKLKLVRTHIVQEQRHVQIVSHRYAQQHLEIDRASPFGGGAGGKSVARQALTCFPIPAPNTSRRTQLRRHHVTCKAPRVQLPRTESGEVHHPSIPQKNAACEQPPDGLRSEASPPLGFISPHFPRCQIWTCC